jgi:hypothetical protein
VGCMGVVCVLREKKKKKKKKNTTFFLKLFIEN